MSQDRETIAWYIGCGMAVGGLSVIFGMISPVLLVLTCLCVAFSAYYFAKGDIPKSSWNLLLVLVLLALLSHIS